VKLHPILFNDEMVRAILEGRKTQTRRPIKPQPAECRWIDRILTMKWKSTIFNPHRVKPRNEILVGCPYGQPGDRLWVRETFGVISPESVGDEQWYQIRQKRSFRIHPESNRVDGIAGAIYRADGEFEFAPGYEKWHPSIHMPRWASRIDLEIASIRVQRVQDISQRDALYEGCPGGRSELNRRTVEMLSDSGTGAAMRVWFRQQWNAIYADRGLSWDINPWVWVLVFERFAE